MNEEMNYNGGTNKKKGNIIIVCLTMIILALIASATVVLLNNNNKDTKKEDQTKKETKQEETTKKEETKEDKEIEVYNPESYRYLIDNLTGKVLCSNYYFEQYKTNKLTNEEILRLVFSELPRENTYLDKKDVYDLSWYDGFGSDADPDTGYETISASKVEKKVKEIFGKNIKWQHKSVEPFVYNKTQKLYVLAKPTGCSVGYQLHIIIDKVTQTKNNLYIYTTVSSGIGAESNWREDINIAKGSYRLYFDYVNLNSDKKINTKYVDVPNVKNDDEKIEKAAKKYINENKDKFAKYKYTFEKEDSNYIIKKLEKID